MWKARNRMKWRKERGEKNKRKKRRGNEENNQKNERNEEINRKLWTSKDKRWRLKEEKVNWT